MTKIKNKNGFTLIEIIITIVVLGLILLITMPIINNIQKKSAEKAELLLVSNIRASASTYATEYSSLTTWFKSTDENNEEIEYACIPVQFLVDKGYLKGTLKSPLSDKIYNTEMIKITRNYDLKVINNGIVLSSEECRYIDEDAPNITIQLTDNNNDIYMEELTNLNVFQHIKVEDKSKINNIQISYNNGNSYEYLLTDGSNKIYENTITRDTDINNTIIIKATDEFNNTNQKSYKLKIDKTPPQLVSLKPITTAGTYPNGTSIVIEATYSENVYDNASSILTSANAPILILKFNTGSNKTATLVSSESNKIKYSINIDLTDEGNLTLVSYSGKVFDQIGNEKVITGSTLSGNGIIAETIAKIGSTYYTSLIEAINSSETTKTIEMINDTVECMTITSNQNITIDLKGKKISCNGTTITNNGILLIKDTLTGGTVISKGAVAINNTGTKTLTIGNIVIKGSTYGIYNTTNGTINIGIATDAYSNTFPSIYNNNTSNYAIYMQNGGTLNFNNGVIYTKNTALSTAYFKGTSSLNARSGYHIKTVAAALDGVNYKKSYLNLGSSVTEYSYRNYDSCMYTEERCVGGNVTNSSCGYASCATSSCGCASYTYTAWVSEGCENTTSQSNSYTGTFDKTTCSPNGNGYRCCFYSRTRYCSQYKTCASSSCGYATCYDSCASTRNVCVGDYTSWTTWNSNTLTGYSYCRKRVGSFDAEGNITAYGTITDC